MSHPAASLIESLLGAALGPANPQAPNRLVLEGLTCRPGDEGALHVGVEKFEAAGLHLAAGAFTAQIGRLSLERLAAVVRFEAGRPRLVRFEAAAGQLSAMKLEGDAAQAGTAAGRATGWSLAPLAAAEGTIRAQIVDAHLLFDADVTVPIRHGRIDFQDATVEHVGPDSRMGVSRMGLYVDAPNGRSYLYQFANAPVAGVSYEQRGALLGPWVSDRGRLQLQPFAESLLGQSPAAVGAGFTEQARALLARTSVSGEVQLGDGRLAAAGFEGELAGRAQGRNALKLHSQAVGRGLTAQLPALSVGSMHGSVAGAAVTCDALEGALALRLSAEGGKLAFALEVERLDVKGLRFAPPPHASS